MASLYAINAEIERIQDSVIWNSDMDGFVDLDTGEIMTEEEYKALFDDLQMERQERLEWMAKCVLNDRSDAAALKTEEERIKKRREAKEHRAELFERLLDRECAGKKTELGVATMSYRKSEAVVFDKKDVPDITKWLEENGHDDCLNYKAPEIRKTELKALIKSGVHVPLAIVEERLNGKLK